MTTTGRPPIISDELTKAITDDLRSGCTIDNAAGCNGVSRTVIYNWLEKGRKGEEPYLTFLNKVNAARDDSERAMVKLIQQSAYEKAGTFNEKAAQWWLTHARRGDWGESKRVEVTGKDGGPIQSLDITKMSDEELKAKLVELQKRIGESLETG